MVRHISPRNKRRLAFALLNLGVILLVCSCTFAAQPMQDLNPKKPKLHAKDDYRSIVFWRVCINDLTGDTTGYHPRLVIGPPGSSERVSSGQLISMSPMEYLSSHATTSSVEGAWEKGESLTSFDGLYAVEARAGTYEFFQFKLDRKNTGIGSSAAVITLPPNPCSIKPDQLLYAGELVVTVEGRKPGTNEYAVVVKTTTGNQIRDSEALWQLFPGLKELFSMEPRLDCVIGQLSTE